MKALTKVLQISATKHGPETPLTIGHLLNICKLADKAEKLNKQYEAEKEEKEHTALINSISFFGQN